ncbi:MAG: glycosyltransferase, partial [Bacteroidota bacterium]|nr:glycosyltransferase [Bacteroidota bacterium]
MNSPTPAMTISVLTTVRNRERSIARSMRSILAQEHADFEYVIIDDGSDDDTVRIVSAFDDDRIRLHALPHAGRGAALNEGLRRCRGNLIAIMDSDDEAHPARLARQQQFMNEHPEVGMLGCHILQRDEGGNAQRVIAFPETHEEILHLMPVTCAVPFNSALIRRSVFDRAGVFLEGLPAAEDYEFALRALRVCRFHNLPEVLNTVQRSRDSMGVVESHAQNEITLAASRAFLDEEEVEASLFTSPEELRFARARVEYYLGELAIAR